MLRFWMRMGLYCVTAWERSVRIGTAVCRLANVVKERPEVVLFSMDWFVSDIWLKLFWLEGYCGISYMPINGELASWMQSMSGDGESSDPGSLGVVIVVEWFVCPNAFIESSCCDPLALTWLSRRSLFRPLVLRRWYVQSIGRRLHREHGWAKSHRTLSRAHRSHALRDVAFGFSCSIWICPDPLAARHFEICRFKISLILDKVDLCQTFVKMLLCNKNMRRVWFRYLKSTTLLLFNSYVSSHAFFYVQRGEISFRNTDKWTSLAFCGDYLQLLRCRPGDLHLTGKDFDAGNIHSEYELRLL